MRDSETDQVDLVLCHFYQKYWNYSSRRTAVGLRTFITFYQNILFLDILQVITVKLSESFFPASISFLLFFNIFSICGHSNPSTLLQTLWKVSECYSV